MEREAKQKEEADEAARNQFPPPPPPMTQQNFVQYMQLVEERQRVTLEQQNKFFQELLQQNRVERPENPGVTLADFQNTKPISFAYAPEPMDAEDWLMDTERKLNTVGCNNQEKVRYATHLLCGPAASWWDNIIAVYPAGKVFTWEEFTRKFRESNVPESIVELKFESLEQKDKAILTYVREFSKLSRYAVEEVNTEDKKKKRFLRGLSPQFKVQLRMMRATEFQELVDAAITLEDDFKQLQEEKRKKAKFEPKRFVSNKPNTSLSFKPRYNNNNNSNYYGSRKNQAFQSANQIVCRSCGFTGHFAKDCKKPKIICFGCRQEGHMLKDCPKRNTGGGQSGGGGSRGGNTGGNWKNKKPFGKLNCTSLEEVVNSDQAVIVIMINKCAFDADLFILPMKDIDVILGMNWLEANGALIDCVNKTVSLKSPDGSRMIYQGDKHTQIEVELQLNSMKEVKLEDIPVVNEFQDVFPAELPAHPKLSTPPDTGGAHTPPLRRHAVLPSYLMASSAAEPPPSPPPPPGGGEGSASTRSGSTPFVEFVCPSGVPNVRVNRGEDWESEGSNAWIPSGIDPALAFRLVARLDSSYTRDSKRYKNGFFFPAVVATTISLRDLKANICAQYSWSSYDAVHFEYFNTEGRFVPLISDDDLGILFALNASCRFGKIRIHVDRGRASSLSGAGASSGGRASCLSTAAASSNSVRRGAPCRSTAAPSVPSASGSQIVRTVIVEDDADIEDQPPQDDEDELMFPELVDRCSKQAMEDQYMEDIAFGARFDDTDDEEKNENDDSLVLADYEGEDLPTIEWNRENPQLVEGTVFQTMMDCRNAITTYHILTKNNFEVVKSEPGKEE
ncbi:hypothetical protein QYE76_011119 [Lolium multiflorum]|uniref:CCHC-type domain-containing protein n=2 Tax=Lolium multiflorum TaxID=4521 RepID=A0AAD8TYK4_LOLMU|nr:hypothetical protein QYE76_011119 [Lolium multiflorum]